MTSEDPEAAEESDRLCALPTPQEIQTPLKNMDDFIKLGWYCTLVLLAAEGMTLTSLSSMVYMVYAGATPTVVIGCGNYYFNKSESCEEIRLFQKTRQCRLIMDHQFVSVNVEFEMVCEESSVVKNSISYQMAGVLFGAAVAGHVSDSFGRRNTLLISLLGLAGFFLSRRHLLKISYRGLTAVQGVYLVENIPKKHRMWINTVITWSPNFIIFPPIVYLCWTWRNLSLFTGAASLISALLLCLVYESPRWMIQKGRIAEARETLEKIRKINRDTCSVEAGQIEAMLRHEQTIFDSRLRKQKKYTIFDIFCTWQYFTWTTTICFGIFVASLVNYGLLFNMEKLSGSLYWNNFFFGVIRWIVNIAVGAADYFFKWVGRKAINFFAMGYIIVSLSIICLLYVRDLQEEGAWLIRYSTIGVTAMTSQLYLAKFMITSELFPTAVRNLAVSTLSVSSRVGTIVAPQLFFFATWSPVLPFFVLLIFSTIDWVACQVLLPETKNKNLENNLPSKDKRIFYRKHSLTES
ncbi:unnamed protein product [Caenorhabditis auriculariae]|uniref:Major facilitator superfamily (MFS) profile domain-containing protein n=1 Tax=Caenorhabditis auriculariae TaxID=2777116 RepID=A0A8S1HM07_9PELO|nr:unnamed protein product [Caenorhabditis auriculariae]